MPYCRVLEGYVFFCARYPRTNHGKPPTPEDRHKALDMPYCRVLEGYLFFCARYPRTNVGPGVLDRVFAKAFRKQSTGCDSKRNTPNFHGGRSGNSSPLPIWRGCSRRGFPVAENAAGCVSRLGAPLCDVEPSATPDSRNRFSGVTAAGSASFPHAIARGPETEQPFREIRAACGAAHLLNFQDDGVVQLFVAHTSYLAFPQAPLTCRASLHSRRGYLASLPPHLDCS